MLGQAQPYSPLADPLADRPVWTTLRRRAGLLLFLHNVMQIFVATGELHARLRDGEVYCVLTVGATTEGIDHVLWQCDLDKIAAVTAAC